MANNIKPKVTNTIVEDTIVVVTTNTDTTVEVLPKKVIKKDIDMGGGKVWVYTEGFVDGETLKMKVNGIEGEVTIDNNFGIFSTKKTFLQYPAIEINL
jgi:hypothetical protein